MDWCAGDGALGDDETDLGRTDCLGRQEDSVEHPDGVLERVEVRPDEGTILPGIVSRSPRSHPGSSSTIHENAVMLSYSGSGLRGGSILAEFRASSPISPKISPSLTSPTGSPRTLATR